MMGVITVMAAVEVAAVLLFLQVICSYVCTVASLNPLTVNVCPHQSKTSQVDWQKVQQSVPFFLSSGQGKPSQETVVRICHNSTHLSVRYDCEDDNVSAIYQSCNDPVWQADAVEFMIGHGSDSPSEYPHYYHELDLGPHPTLFAATISNPNDNCTGIQDYYLQCNTVGMAWEFAVVSSRTAVTQYLLYFNYATMLIFNQFSLVPIAVSNTEAHQGNTLLEKYGWWAVMTISFDFLASVPAQSDLPGQNQREIQSSHSAYIASTWRANFYRVDSPKGSGRLEYSSWQPTDMDPPCFHVPSKFGVLNITN